MPTIAFHTVPGKIGIATRPDPRKHDPAEPTEIHLGPLPPPPLPLGVVLGGDGDRNRSSHNKVRIQLDKAFKTGTIDPAVLKQIRDAALATPQSASFEIDAELPLHRMIDLDLLSRHASAIGAQVGRQVAMRLAPADPEK